jgi:UDP-glucuronate decarboxylase
MPLPSDDPKQRRPDITRAKTHLGWEPQIALREGLTATIAYFENLLAVSEHTDAAKWLRRGPVAAE